MLLMSKMIFLVCVDLAPLLLVENISVGLTDQGLHNNPLLGVLSRGRSPHCILLVLGSHDVDVASVGIVKLTSN